MYHCIVYMMPIDIVNIDWKQSNFVSISQSVSQVGSKNVQPSRYMQVCLFKCDKQLHGLASFLLFDSASQYLFNYLFWKL